MFISNTNVKKNISRSKTDQMGRGNWINLYACSGSSVCLVKLQIRPLESSSFFIHELGLPLNKYQFICVFKNCLKMLNLQNSHVTFHSFRIRATTEASRLGLDANIIKKVGRWKSDSYLLYTGPNQFFLIITVKCWVIWVIGHFYFFGHN